MTNEEKVSVLAGLVDADARAEFQPLLTYVTLAGQKVLNRCYPFGYEDGTPVPERYEALQVEAAAYMWNKRGALGQTSHSENGVARGYENGDLPESLMRQITPRGMVY